MKRGFSLAAMAAVLWSQHVYACGCFAPPNVAQPVIQAGERILFSVDQGVVTALIQIQYQGQADQFGWLVPLPSVPTLQLGTDEVFASLDNRTLPQYQMGTQVQTNCPMSANGEDDSGSGGGCGNAGKNQPSYGVADGGAADMSLGGGSDLGAAPAGPVVEQSSIGPFDYAVLHADDQTEMLNWLSTNKYFVPSGTDAVLKPYIHPGAYFLALKLKSGESAGSIVPVIVKYASDLPMIPLILTSVGAVPDMGIQVWLLGDHRAIPRNYRNVVLNDLPVFLSQDSYQSLLVRAVKEAPQRHAFVTEYAGPSTIMQGVLDYPGRFGDATTLAATQDPGQYLSFIRNNGFVYDSTLIAILEKYLPPPTGFNPAIYYFQNAYTGSIDPVPASWDPVALTNDIETRIVQPTLATGKLFHDHPYLTRMFTALSPEDMTADPVFSENPDLPDVQLAHTATQSFPCQGTSWITDGATNIEAQSTLLKKLPGALYIQTLREAGWPIVDTDNTDAIVGAIGPVSHGTMPAAPTNPNNLHPSSNGCSVAFPRSDRGTLLFVLVALFAARWIVRRRRA